MSFQGDEEVQMIYNILVTEGSIKEAQEQLAALYGFDSFEEVINFFRADKNPENNNDGSAEGNDGPKNKGANPKGVGVNLRQVGMSG